MEPGAPGPARADAGGADVTDLNPESWRALLTERYGEREADFIVADVRALEHASTEDDFEYLDNRRVMRVGADDEAQAYEAQRASGCCGEYDTETGVSPAGYRYRWGFNYGH